MNWNPHVEAQYINSGFPYTTIGSFMEYFEGLTYDHVNFIFAGATHAQDSMYPSINMNPYKFGTSEPGSTSYYNDVHAYEVDDHAPRIDDFDFDYRSPLANSDPTPAVNTYCEGNANTAVQCPLSYNAHDYPVTWQDNIDPDNMTYEELLELGEAVGTQSRGLSKEHISMLPISKYKCCFFSRKKSQKERCVICQMEYKRGDRQITLPCKHAYHSGCGFRWLSINKACPICYIEVFGNAANTRK